MEPNVADAPAETPGEMLARLLGAEKRELAGGYEVYACWFDLDAIAEEFKSAVLEGRI